MLIRKIDIDSIEKYLKAIVETSSQTRLMQDQLENVLANLESNESHFKILGISKVIYNENKERFEKEKRSLSSEIAKSVKKVLNNVNALEKKFANCKI
ncbi:MAG TPA: hypothetical protein VJ343_02855 [archaeon]|nr:hypothetical protein [archaeon]